MEENRFVRQKTAISSTFVKPPGVKHRCERIVYVLQQCGDVVFATMCIWLTRQSAYKYAIEVNFKKF